MSDDKKNATKEYVVVFDQLDAHTGEFRSQGVGMPQVAVTKSYFRGDKVSLDDETAQRHLDVGAVLPADDKRAKLVKPNEARATGVKRDVDQVLPSAVQLEQHAGATVPVEGARRSAGGKLGTKGELAKLPVKELKALAAEHGVEVERGDTRAKLAAKLAKVRVADAGAGDDETVNPGQGKDESPPPPDQPDEKPDGATEE